MSREHLKAELEAAGLRLGDSSERDAFLQELEHLLQPEVHEGGIVSCGCVSFSGLENVAQLGRVVEQPFPIETARRLADGVSSFVAIHAGQYAGLLVLDSPCSDETALMRLQQTMAGYVAVTDSFGRTKICTDEGILLHQLRRWRTKPPVNKAIDALAIHFPAVKKPILCNILLFCYYTLSPANTGATVVWYVVPPGAAAQRCAPVQTNAAPLNIDFSSGSGFKLAHALLARTDGAAVLDAEGRMLGIEVQLAVSDRSRDIIPSAPGTRRTSARRYSYDVPEAIVFAVSADGPVSVFSDGLEVAKLSSIDPEAFASFITSSAHTRKRACVGQSESVCARCGKTSIIINTEVHGMRERETANCGVCGNEIASEFTSDLSTQVIKRLAGEST